MNLYYETKAALQRYMVTRDKSMLDQIIALTNAELDDPTLQECVLTLDNMGLAEADAHLSDNHCIKISTAEVTNSAPVVLGKWVRLLATDQPENTCILLKVAHFDEKVLVLVPASNMLSTSE